MGEEDLADSVLLNLDHIDLARFEVVGNYVRYDEKTRHALKDFRRKVMAGFDGSLGSKENYLIWGPPGSGKTFLVQELARSMGAPAYVELNLAESNEGRFRASLDILESTPQHTLCLVDEADSKAEESWPYELLLRHLEPPEGRRKREATEGFCDQLRETNTSRRGPDQVRRPVRPGRPREQGVLDPNATGPWRPCQPIPHRTDGPGPSRFGQAVRPECEASHRRLAPFEHQP